VRAREALHPARQQQARAPMKKTPKRPISARTKIEENTFTTDVF